MGVEAVAGPGLSVHEIIASVGQQAELGRAVLEPDRRQVGLAEGHPGDREGIARIALAGPTAASSFAPAQVGRDLADDEPGRDEVVSDRGTVRGRALDPDPDLGSDASGPGRELDEARRITPYVRSSMTLPTASTAQAARVRLWVSIPMAAMPLPPAALRVRWLWAGRAAVR